MLFTSSVFATPKKTYSPTTNIQKRCAEIQTNLKNQRYTTKRISDERFDDVVTAYFQNNRIELIVSEIYGEAGKIRHEYYFGKNGELILATNQLFQYKTQQSSDKNLVKVSENTYYYQKMKLVRAVDGKNAATRTSHYDTQTRSRYLLGKSLILTKQIKEQHDEIIGQYQQNSDLAKLTRRKPTECGAGCD
ncbi:hypothetical protein [Emticicia sp.]|uniref:hypothetical protein n=1 Tax=Emticicia sp. TaxID=1930953 RepID=UPI003BA913CA